MFSGKEMQTLNVTNGFKIFSMPNSNVLVFERPDEETHTVIVSENIDSIAWDDKYIYGFADNRYFLISQRDRIPNWTNSRKEFTEASKLNHEISLTAIGSLTNNQE
jgi:hypothetical protein